MSFNFSSNRSPARRTFYATLFGAVLGCMAIQALAQSDDDTSSRFPANGVPVLDCAPNINVIQDTCVLRVPPSQERVGMIADVIGDGIGSFEFLRPEKSRFPDDVTLIETIILIDLTPGPGGARRATFKTEQQLIRQFVQSLPSSESIAIYGFNEQMVRLSNFSRDRSVALSAIDNMTLTGTNTRISTFTKEAIGILDGRKDTLIKNVFVISDGDEEGERDAAGVTEMAVDAGVSISSLGIFWRAIGASETGAGMDYLESLTADTLGSSVAVQLRRPAEARETMSAFQHAVSKSFVGSGIIVPVGDAKTADIVVTMKKPTIGVSGAFAEEKISARFTPVSSNEEPATTSVEIEGPAAEKLIFGYPAMWIYAAGVGTAGLFLLLLILLLRKPRADDEDEFDFDDFDDAVVAIPRPTPASKPAAAKAYGYLVENKGRRIPITSRNASIGRSADNTVTLPDDSISRNHAQLTRTSDGAFRLVDLGSLNGTFVNGKKVTEKVAVSSGDQIKFGEVETRLVLI
jgi:hypothetical protein